MPPSCRKKSRWNQHWILWRRTSHFWSLIDVDIQPSPRSASSPAQIPQDNPAKKTIQNHLRRHLPSSTSTTLYSTLLYEPNSTLNSTQPNSTLNSTQPNSTQHNSNPSSGIQSPVCDKVDALTALSVQPQGSQLQKVGGWNQDTIHLEIEEVLEEKKNSNVVLTILK